MKRFAFNFLTFLTCAVVFEMSSIAQTFTWNGTSSSSWNTSTNWTPNGIPGAGNVVNINNNSVPNICVLDINRSVGTLNVNSGASFNFGGNLLTVTGTSTLNNAVLSNTNLTSG